MPESSRKIEEIFDAAIEIASLQERRAYVEEACAGDAALFARIEDLLCAHDETRAFLPEKPQIPLETAVIGEKPGDRIGRYKLLQRIGEGGCGVVYMAEQEEPVRRRVALKVIKLGLDTRSVIARFEAERQALAMMDHANIAKMFDAGATDAGRPYFVMELVPGVRITEYCDQNNISVADRLALFIEVCGAVQHAHQKGIVHRDLKPANILISINDGEPVPKVIDFGIAKAIANQKLTDKTVFTAFGQFVGTLGYMSPEQVTLTTVDIDTRSDIYSLGVLLYELLTGRQPFDAKELAAAGADEVRRTICKEEPLRPSTRVSKLIESEQTSTAKCRQSNPWKLVRLLHGELDWIVIKCLEKDRSRRYETVEGLASDVQRHLDSEPIIARPPSKLYRFQKTVRRNKLVFAAASVVSISLLIGFIVSNYLYVREIAAELKAQTAQRREEAIKNFMVCIFRSPHPESVGRDVKVIELLDQALSDLKRNSDSKLRGALLDAIGSSYVGLGLYSNAVEVLEQALNAQRKVFGNDDFETVKTMCDLGHAYRENGQWQKALPLNEQMLRIVSPQFAKDYPDLTITMTNNMATTYQDAGRLSDAIRLYEQIVPRLGTRLGDADPKTIRTMDNLATAYEDVGRVTDAIPLFEKVFTVSKSKLGDADPRTLECMHNLAYAYQAAGRLSNAVPLFEKSVELHKLAFGANHPYVFDAQGALGRALVAAERFANAEVPLRACLAYRASHIPDHWQRYSIESVLGAALLGQRKMAEAELLLLSGYEGMDRHLKEIPAYAQIYIREALERLVELYAAKGDTNGAADWERKLRDFILNKVPRRV
jgi:serine/threonine protein kinase